VKNVLFETDLPHPTYLYPGPVAHAAKVLAHLPNSDRKAVMQDNASCQHFAGKQFDAAGSSTKAAEAETVPLKATKAMGIPTRDAARQAPGVMWDNLAKLREEIRHEPSKWASPSAALLLEIQIE
jgi:hypothetical protein